MITGNNIYNIDIFVLWGIYLFNSLIKMQWTVKQKHGKKGFMKGEFHTD